MAEYIVQKTVRNKVGDTSTVFTGDSKRQLFPALEKLIAKAKGIEIMVAYTRESGVRMLLPALIMAVKKGVSITLLTGTDFNLTEPQALYLLRSYLGDKVELRFYKGVDKSFHPKAYFFHLNSHSCLIIGSSNLSASALGESVEWNYCLNSQEKPQEYDAFYQTFQDIYRRQSILVDDEVLRQYARNWRKPQHFSPVIDGDDVGSCQPRGAQIEALYYLQKTRDEGADKALIHAATGIGKTYLAAFDSKPYAKVLFIAHREEILQQAALAFCNVRGSDDYGFFTGKIKQQDKSLVFASVETLGQMKYLQGGYFAVDYFDYIVVDEFHHAVSNLYQNILHYFRPKFLLGLTATTERMDGRCIYALCDYNVPFELSLFAAINRGMLVPFRYYGIFDDTDYKALRPVSGSYAASDLNCIYLDNIQRMKNILKHYQKYHSQRALGFCASREHAEAMAKFFVKEGIRAAAVYSNAKGKYTEERAKAIELLNVGGLQVIFAVDMFNEGVDIPALDMVMFLRPTESPTVFMQQLGRGLRLFPSKEYLTVLDFIGNYHNAGVVRGLLCGEKRGSYGEDVRLPFPDSCYIDFDLRLLDLFEQVEKGRQSLRTIIKEEFSRIERLLGKRPTRVELFEHMDASLYEQCLKHPQESPFKHYWHYLEELGELRPEEQELQGTLAEEFLLEITNTPMTKVYKMPVLLALQGEQKLKSKISYSDILVVWKAFFARDCNWRDLPKVERFQEYQKLSDKWHLAKIKKMPITYLQSEFLYSKGEWALVFCAEMEPYLKNPVVRAEFEDLVNYRALDYYRRRYLAKEH
ncbi:MAG: DEAD/DEAH box helicase family protein [Selenomonadaceae bacterium]|nr:DEAD/DEAH box helicase family protein [Selenomonadaceae bacterium]